MSKSNMTGQLVGQGAVMKSRTLILCGFISGGLMLINPQIRAQDLPNVQVVAPVELDEVLVNPGMGFTTQSSLDGDVPGYPASTIAYYRWYWNVLEPAEGKYSWSMIDSVIAMARSRGQRLATRIMPTNGHDGVPEWYRKTGARGFEYLAEETIEAGTKKNSWMPDHEDPLYLKYMGRLVKEFARRYDGHPDIDHIDIGSYGHWGEWHLSFVEGKEEYPFATKKIIIDWYLEGFKKTPLVICEDAAEGLRYATEHGAGWRADCMGDYGPPNNWNLMAHYLELPKIYPSVNDAWKTRPVCFESCSTMEDWLLAGRDIEYIWSVCLELHTSVFNNKSAPIPPEWWPATERFLKRMGYRLIPRLVRHPKWVEPGGTLTFEMELDNTGVAPPYRAYKPVIEIRSLRSHHRKSILPLQETNWNVLEWLPGRHRHSMTIPIPADAKPGRYGIYFALLDPFTNSPVVQLAVQGGDANRWYTWSAFEIVEKGKLQERIKRTD